METSQTNEGKDVKDDPGRYHYLCDTTCRVKEMLVPCCNITRGTVLRKKLQRRTMAREKVRMSELSRWSLAAADEHDGLVGHKAPALVL